MAHSRKYLDRVSCGEHAMLSHRAFMRRTMPPLVAVLVCTSVAAARDSRQPPSLEVTFSAPVEGEADVRLDTSVRIQFSRDVDPRSLEKRIRMSYSADESAERGEAQPPSITFEIRYQPGTRGLEVRPSRPLERFRHVSVDLLDGIVGTDGSALGPWSLHFATGGS
jgi:Big-like domain-containing protein